MKIIQLQILLTFILIGYNPLYGQGKIKMINASTYKSDQYDDAKGSPYLWKENKEVVIFDTNGTEYYSVSGNYNALDQEFEVYKGSDFIRLPHDTYVCIKVKTDKGEEYSLFSNVHPKLKNKYCILRGQNDKFKIYENVNAKMSVVTMETPGKATVVKKIKTSSKYYIVYGSDLISFKKSKKKLAKKFGHKKEIKKFIKENDLDVKNFQDLIVLFTYLDENDWLIEPN